MTQIGSGNTPPESGQRDPNVQRSHVAIRRFRRWGRLEQQQVATLPSRAVVHCLLVDAVRAVPRVARSPGVVRALLSVYRIGESIVEEELRREFLGLLGPRVQADLEVDMDGAAHVPAGFFFSSRRRHT